MHQIHPSLTFRPKWHDQCPVTNLLRLHRCRRLHHLDDVTHMPFLRLHPWLVHWRYRVFTPPVHRFQSPQHHERQLTISSPRNYYQKTLYSLSHWARCCLSFSAYTSELSVERYLLSWEKNGQLRLLMETVFFFFPHHLRFDFVLIHCCTSCRCRAWTCVPATCTSVVALP